MEKTFTWNRPDEPYVNSSTGTRTIDITYTGPRYLLVELDPKLGTGSCIRSSEDENDPILDASNLAHNQWEYVIVDAEELPALACSLTLAYKHPDPNDWTETLTDADGEEFVFEHTYDETTGVIDHETAGLNGGYTYNFNLKTWEGPEYREHMVSATDFENGRLDMISQMQNRLDNKETLGYTAEQIESITNYKEYLESVPTKYADIPHWKLPSLIDYPENI